MAYLGYQPPDRFNSAFKRQSFTGNGTMGPFVLDLAVVDGSEQGVEVFVGNVRQEPTVAYTIGGTGNNLNKELLFTESPDNGESIYVIHKGDTTLAISVPDNFITNNKLADNAVTGNKILDNAVTGNKILDDSITPAKTSFLKDNTNNSAIFEVDDSSNKGTILTPKMTETQRDAISNPATALVIYNTDKNKLNIYNGTQWEELGGGDGPQSQTNAADIFTNFVKDMEDHGRTSMHTEAGFVDELEASNDMIDEANSSGFLYDATGDFYSNITTGVINNVEYTTESNYLQQEWTNQNQSTSQATVAGGTTGEITNALFGPAGEQDLFGSGNSGFFSIEFRAPTISGISRVLNSITIKIRNINNSTDGLIIKLYLSLNQSSNGGDPDVTGTLQATSSTVNGNTIGSTEQEVTFDFSGFVLTPNVRYCAVLSRTGSVNTNSYYKVKKITDNVNVSSNDFSFKISDNGTSPNTFVNQGNNVSCYLKVNYGITGSSVTLSSGTWPTNAVNGRISFDVGSTWFDIESRDSNTQLTLGSTATNGTFDYKLRMSEFDSGSVQLNNNLVQGGGGNIAPDAVDLFSSGTLSSDIIILNNAIDSNIGHHSRSLLFAYGNHSSETFWLGLDFGSAKVIEKISFDTTIDSLGGLIKAYKLYGSNSKFTSGSAMNSTGAILLDSGSVSGNNLPLKTFSNTTAYRYYYFVSTGTDSQVNSSSTLGPYSYLTELYLHEVVINSTSNNPINEYTSIITKESFNTNVTDWADINSTSIIQTGSGDANYWLGFNPTTGYGPGTEAKIFHQGDSVWRTIAKNNAGTWEYNSSVPSTSYGPNIAGTATVSASQETESASGAIDGNTSTRWFSANDGPAEWIKLDFGASNEKTIRQYKIYIDANHANAPIDFTFEGSNDDSNFTTLDTQSGLSWSSPETKTFNSFTNTTGYRYYRVNITAVGETSIHSHYGPLIYELEMMEGQSVVLADVYSGTSSSTNDMLHAVSQGISSNAANRMTETQAEAITDAEFEASNGFDSSTHTSLFRGVTLQSTNVSNNISVDSYGLNYDFNSNIDLRTKQWTGSNGTPDAPSESPETMYLFVVDEQTSGTPQYAVTRNGSTYTNVTFDRDWIFDGTKRARRATIDVSSQPAGTDPRMKVTNSNTDDFKLHAVGLQTKK